MSKITIYHHPQCSKSRGCLAFLTDKNYEIEVIEYVKNPLSKQEIVKILGCLNLSASEIIRKKEPIWQEFKDKQFSEEELIALLEKYPKLIERPIVIKDGKGIIARPIEKLFEWLPEL